MIIKHANITKFRALHNVDFDLGSKLTAIVGHNATMKTSILGILSQTFTISPGHIMHGSKTIDGYNFHSQFHEKFKLSEKDIPGDHLWKLDLYQGIYKNEYFEAHSIERDKKTTIPRFWSTEGKGSGTGYPQIPAYYISLKRVTPIGEENKINYLSELSAEEKRFLITEYKEIFAITGNDNLSIDSISSSNKHTASIHNQEHDALAISAGQDNLGKLLIAVLSFRRLKEQFGNEYKGGLLLIDEIESTFHPAAQTRLVKRIYKYARDYKIQFVFTTHSPAVIKSAFFDKYNTSEAQLLYLKKVGDNIVGHNNPDIDSVIAELSGEVINLKKKKDNKIEVYSEDEVAKQILTNWLSPFKNHIKFSTCSLGAEEYIELLRVGLKPIKEAVVVLDGDKNNVKNNKSLEKLEAKNVIFLPSCDCPEKMFYKFLYDLPEDDAFWDNTLGGYDKEKCFSGYATLSESNSDSEKYKKWFEANKRNWERSNKKLYDYWKITQTYKYEQFIDEFKKAFNTLAMLNDSEPLD
jgi:predicted ATPase